MSLHQSSHEGQEYSEVTCKLDEEFVGKALYCYVIVICWAYSHRILKVKYILTIQLLRLGLDAMAGMGLFSPVWRDIMI